MSISRYHRLVESDEHYEELLEFLHTGGDPNLMVYESSTLLHVAARSFKWNAQVVHELIDAGADIDLETSSGSTPLIFAVMSRNHSAVHLLIEAGAQVNVRSSFGRTALHYAIDSCIPRHQQLPFFNNARNSADIWILAMLLYSGDIDVNPVNTKDETPLMWAVKQKHIFAVELLLRKGANPNMLDRRSRNSLHLALLPSNPNSFIVYELLKNGVDIYHKDNLGVTPIDIIFRRIHDEDSLLLASEYLMRIALKYHIKKDLEHKVAHNPWLKQFLRCARKEVEWMHEQIIYDKVTLHDFASGCFQERADAEADPTNEIYKPVVEILLSGKYLLYLDHLLHAMSKRELQKVLESLVYSFYYIVGPVVNPLSPNQTHWEIFESIEDCYERITQYNRELMYY